MENTIRRISILTGILLAMSTAAFGQQSRYSNPPLARTAAEKKILAVLDRMVKNHETYLSVPQEDGEALWVLTEAAGAKRVAEIGTSTGYSGLWFSMALTATGGHLTTFEIDHQRFTEARQHFEEAGVAHLVTQIEGDAHENVKKLQGPIDVVFIDADKDGYVDYLHKLLPLVRPGGLVLAHNINMAPDYVRAVTTNPDLQTIFYMQGAGLGVTLKKR
ncbi:MAG TPA: class I SAM-dependent methyltransferase [Terriglobia bacterium]|nr:class I SAM-dependent methyltransferase [Terriglobia bacterium]